MTNFIPPARTSSHWAKIGLQQQHGINIFLPSLHSNDSSLGYFDMLIKLLPWLKKIGFSVMQLLPLNDSGADVSPYNIVSVHALNPLYVKEEVIDERAFQSFCVREASWLKGYTLFKALKVKNHETAFWRWPEEEKSYNEDLYKKYKTSSIPFAKTQFLAHLQLCRVKEAAEKLGISLLGDLPILVSPDSVEVWQHPSLFERNFDVGAPPDLYEQEGQHWGFPLHRFDVMQKEQFRWWKERLQTASSYYDLYRIDHVIGLFRLWAIAKGQKAKEGFFNPTDLSLAMQQGRAFLTAFLESSSMLPIAEDLGVIPLEVRELLNNWGIPSTKVTRWERYWQGDQSLIPPREFPPCSLTTVSTHDSETLGAWWSKEYKKTLDFPTRFQLLQESHKSGSLFHINLLSEYLALFPDLVYTTEAQERINIPGRVNQTNWRYKTRRPLEEIIAHKGLKDVMAQLIC